MIIQTLAFYAFSAVTVGAAVMVISARNPVHSVLFLILAFFNAAGLFVLLGAEFIAMILVDCLCRRGRRFVPVRRHDAGYQLCRASTGLLAISAYRRGLSGWFCWQSW